MPKVNLKAVLHNCTATTEALQASLNAKLQTSEAYQKTLEEFREAMEAFHAIEMERHYKLNEIAKKTEHEKSLLEFQNWSNNKVQNWLIDIEKFNENCIHDFDSFENSTKNVMNELCSLNSAFDKSALVEKTESCVNNKKTIQEEICVNKNEYELFKSAISKNQNYFELSNFEKSYNFDDLNSVMTQLKTELYKCNDQLTLAQKNIDFLKQQNEE